MIVVDTSAIIAIANNEPSAPACIRAIDQHNEILISAGTAAEILIVAARKNVSDDVQRLISGLEVNVIDVTEALARRAGEAYRRWGKGLHPAGLNFGDCFAYALAIDRNCPLLYIGNDFSMTDVVSALPAES